MEFEVTYDPIADAVESGLLINDDHELLPDGEWIRFARRVTKHPELFIYRHKLTGNFVLAGWVYNPKEDGIGVATELHVMETPPDRGGWMETDSLIRRCRPFHEQVLAVKARIKKASSIKKSLRHDDLLKKKDVSDHYRRMGDIEMASMIEAGPYCAEGQGGEGFERLKDELTTMASNRTITSG